MNGQDTVTGYYQAQAKHNRKLKALARKSVCKWQVADFEGLKATRADRDSAVAALTLEQKLQHVDGLPKAEGAKRLAARPTAEVES